MENFTLAVDEGLRLAKRVCYGKDRYTPPKPPIVMDKSTTSSSAPENLQPTGPMMYAVIYDPAMVDNPDLPSYQPHVYGRIDPPALIPLQMNEVGLEIKCFLDSAVVTMKGSWRLHCVMGSRRCDCRLVVPMGEQGSLLGVEAEVLKQVYYTEIVSVEETETTTEKSKYELRGFLKPDTFSLIVPKVSGGSIISVTATWVQKLLYRDGNFSIQIPFSFPEFVNPVARFARRERIKLSINTGTVVEVLCHAASHALKETRRQSGSLFFSYEADTLTWSSLDFHFSYTAYSSNLYGGLIFQSAKPYDVDRRDMFSLYLFPGNGKHKKAFRNNVVFIVDTSESMQGRTIESTINALSTSISKLSPDDSFSIIAFNDEISTFSSSLKTATSEVIKDAMQWMNKNLVAGGGTNIMQPLEKALDMLSDDTDTVPHIFLATDGSVEDERSICSFVRTRVANRGAVAPRISTFGLGLYCNHYFLHMLATISRGQYDAAFDADSVESRMQGLIERALSPVLVNITLDNLDNLDDALECCSFIRNRNVFIDDALEVYPFPIPDLSYGSPLIVSGRCQGKFPDSVKVKGVLADKTIYVVDFKVQQTNDIPLDKVCARQQIDLLTAQAWFSGSKQLEEKVINLSKLTSLTSEYCNLVLNQREDSGLVSVQEGKKVKLLKRLSSKECKILPVEGLKIGFGDVTATVQNYPTGFGDVKPPEASAVFQKAIGCCSSVVDCFCCMCCIRACSRMNDQCAIAITQLCAALSCLACFECCSVCCDND